MAIFFIFLIVFNTMGSYFIFIGWKIIMSKKIETIATIMPLSSLTKISKVYEGFVENEFEIEGKMYDVISHQISQKTINYFCVNDFEEDCINTFTNTNNNLNNYILKCKKTSKNIIKTLYKPIIGITQNIAIWVNPFQQIILLNILYSILKLSIENKVPPPKQTH